ncbi:hypothetical protein WR25_01603 isoform B [Diploscapter pachys]|uniref:G-protein coupled receptors family 1 profile domain-containing protein n=1 Tax=Diploscapter pachys TaxID=2018661 RepID=A0A2A2KJX2_9BILA|nr:hypothetical protein WR25_01603 isoform A [Diploscapter pachys]PAV74162.1 hypothetical protein WR25_01603 isoform B [Diploscapter pachys]
MMCYVSFLVQGASLIWLPFTLTGIAVDRYLLVASPFRRQMSMKTCVLVIIGIWVGSFAVLGPYVSHVNYIEMFGCAFCIEDWKNEEGYRMLYGLCILLVRSALPLSIISICHWRIARILHQQNNKFKTMRSNSISSQSNEIRRRQRLQTLLLAMCLIFAFSSLPMDMFSVIQDWTMYKRSGNDGRTKHQSHPIPDYLMHFIFYFFHWLAMSGSILNPLVYAYFNENFRRHIQLCCVDFRNNGSFKHGFYTVITPNALQARLENTTPRNLLVPEETQQLKTTMEELQTLEVVEEHPEDVHV